VSESSYLDTVREICEHDTRYDPQAYFFVREALDFTVKKLKKPSRGAGRHVSGQELLGGIKKYALREFGPMSNTVLNTWGIGKTEDFGEIVFNLVAAGELGKTEEDSRADFSGGYDFYEAFVKPFLPPRTKKGRPSSKSQRPMSRPRPPKSSGDD
jgi:uncharacterized repeat protein (TIGR04138 family)